MKALVRRPATTAAHQLRSDFAYLSWDRQENLLRVGTSIDAVRYLDGRDVPNVSFYYDAPGHVQRQVPAWLSSHPLQLDGFREPYLQTCGMMGVLQGHLMRQGDALSELAYLGALASNSMLGSARLLTSKKKGPLVDEAGLGNILPLRPWCAHQDRQLWSGRASFLLSLVRSFRFPPDRAHQKNVSLMEKVADAVLLYDLAVRRLHYDLAMIALLLSPLDDSEIDPVLAALENIDDAANLMVDEFDALSIETRGHMVDLPALGDSEFWQQLFYEYAGGKGSYAIDSWFGILLRRGNG